MNNKPLDPLEQLFQGIDIIVDKKLSEVAYDTTIVCTVTDISNAKNGEYQVSDGTIKFKVFSEDNYKLNEQVRVQIPQGDYTRTKYIIGKHVVDNSTAPITYVSPMDTIVDITGNIFTIEDTDKTKEEEKRKQYESMGLSITANGEQLKEILYNKDLTEETQESEENGISIANLQQNGIYTNIYLKADFKTSFSNLKLCGGTYGLQLDLLIKPAINSSGKIRQTIRLSSKEMFGNPYNFSIFTPQSKLINIRDMGTIEQIILSLYQDGDFIDKTRGKIAASQTPNIYVKNIEIGFGSDISEIDDNVVKIYTLSDLEYSYDGKEANQESTENTKSLNLLWYNKNENNQYLGFSDGVYSPGYDEIKYLDDSWEDSRRVAQIGKMDVATDSDSLCLKSNLIEITELLTKAKGYVDKDIVTNLNVLITQFNADDAANRELVAKSKENVLILSSEILALTTKLYSQYNGVLQYGAKVQPNPDNPELKDLWNTEWDVNYYSEMLGKYASIKTTVLNMFTTFQNSIKANESVNGYQGVHDTYLVKFNNIFTDIEKLLNKVRSYADGDFELMKSYNVNAANKKTNWVYYQQKDFSSEDNKYCIYWYRYDKGYVNDDEKFMEPGWKLLDKTDFIRCPATSTDIVNPIVNKLYNAGLPDKGELGSDNKYYYQVRLNIAKPLLEIAMRPELEEEKFMAVIFYNHEMFKSNELVFRNRQELVDKNTLDNGDSVLTFEHLTNSRKSYYNYADSNYLIDGAEAYKFRQLRCHYDGHLGQDETLKNAGIYWYVPNTSSMIDFDDKELKSKGFTTDKDGATPMSRDGFYYYYKKINMTETKDEETGETILSFLDEDGKIDTRDFWYKIKPFYEQTSHINRIECEIHLEGRDDAIYGEELLSFGIASTNGTKYTLAVTNKTNQTSTTDTSNLPLDVSLRDYNNNSIDIYRNGSAIDDNITSGFKSEWYFKLSGTPDDSIRLVPSIDPVKELDISKGSCGILKNTVTLKDSALGSGIVNLEQVCAVPWSSGDYYISGPTTIIYNSQGAIDNKSLFDSPYALYWGHTVPNSHNANGKVEAIWSIEHYDKNGQLVTNPDITKYLPKLNSAGGITPQPMYISDLSYFSVVCAKDSSGKYLWKQPIIVLQNRFGTALLNSWDGSLVIDDKNGTIMSTMIGAGKKNADNSFSGVLMGDIQSATQAKNGVGIFGYHQGAQSFGLNVDGTAFFGKSGRGRIEIDGNDSVIRSSDWTKSGNWWVLPDGKSGTLLDLDDAILMMKDVHNDSGKNRESHVYFNREGQGKLEILANGADIQFNNKSGANVTSYIDTAVQGLTTEVRRAANYYGVCETGSSFTKPASEGAEWTEVAANQEKKITLTLDVGQNMANKTSEAVDDYGIPNIDVATNILKTGTTIAVTFTNAQYVKEVITVDETAQVEGTEADSAIPTSKTVTRTGHLLTLNINNVVKNVYIDKTVTGTNNPFGWEPGSTIYFTYYNISGAEGWYVTDSGAYSRTVQTGDYIRNEVVSDISKTATTILQTADSIRQEARQYAGYYGTCSTTTDLVKEVVVANVPQDGFSLENLLKEGIGLAVTFDSADTIKDRAIKLKLCDKKDTNNPRAYTIEIPVSAETNDFSWQAGSTVYFMYVSKNGGNYWQVSDAGSYSRITQTAHSITSEVRRTATYKGVCETPGVTDDAGTSSNATKVITLTNALSGSTNEQIAPEEVYQTGVTIAINFTYSQTTKQQTDKQTQNGKEIVTITTKGYAPLYISWGGKTCPIYIKNITTSIDNPYGWEEGSTIYFVYDSSDGGKWHVGDSGSFSRITQTADKILSEVQTEDGANRSLIEQTATSITSEVRRNYGYSCIVSETKYPNTGSDKDHVVFVIKFRDSNQWFETVETTDPVLKFKANTIFNVSFNSSWDAADKNIEGALFEFSDIADYQIPIYINGGPIKNSTKNGKNLFGWTAGANVQFKIASLADGSQVLQVTNAGSYSKLIQTADAINASVVHNTGANSSKTFGWNLTANGFFLGRTNNPGPEIPNTPAADQPYDHKNTVFLCDSGGITVKGNLEADRLYINDNASFKGVIEAGSVDISIQSARKHEIKVSSKSNNIISIASAEPTFPEVFWRDYPSEFASETVTDIYGNTYTNITSHWMLKVYLLITPTKDISVDSSTRLNVKSRKLLFKKKDGTADTGTLKSGETYYYAIEVNPDYVDIIETKQEIDVPVSEVVAIDEVEGDDIVIPDVQSQKRTIITDVKYKLKEPTGYETPLAENLKLVYYPKSSKGLIIDLTNGKLTLNKQLRVNGTGIGYISIGAPLDSTSEWDEVSVMPMKTSGGTGPIGNLGVPNHPWDVLCVRYIKYTSDREEKNNIVPYNINTAYDEMKNMPIFTYNYNSEGSIVKNSPMLGTMIEYVPGEAMVNDGSYTDGYNPQSMLFWDIAATKVLQNKLEEALERIEELENQVEELQNGTN